MQNKMLLYFLTETPENLPILYKLYYWSAKSRVRLFSQHQIVSNIWTQISQKLKHTKTLTLFMLTIFVARTSEGFKVLVPEIWLCRLSWLHDEFGWFLKGKLSETPQLACAPPPSLPIPCFREVCFIATWPSESHGCRQAGRQGKF